MAAGRNQRFGPYVILDRIGEGGMAEIFLAKIQGYSGFEKLIALKKILPKFSQNHTFAHMLIHEAKLAAALNHFNVVQVYDLGEIDGQVFIAMEYVRGRDLSSVLANTYRHKESLPIELSLFIATEFLTGLEYAHRLRGHDGAPLSIIHRDISPQNILISYEGEVKVTDFGIARVISEDPNENSPPSHVHGKFGYMSPEQASNQLIDQRSDIFSAGVVLWEMLVGSRLFRGRNQQDTVNMVTDKPIPPPSSLNPAVPSDVDAICLKALARDKNYRYQTMGAFLGALSHVADSRIRRAGHRDLSVYMRRQFGTPSGGFRPGRGQQVDPANQPLLNSVDLSPQDETNRVLIGQILMEQGSISMGDLELALAEQRAQGGRIGEVLVSAAAIDDKELATALARQAQLPSITTDDLVQYLPPSQLLSRFPRHAAEASCILPVEVDADERVVRLAVCDPYDERGVLEAKVVLGVNEVALLVAPRSAIRDALASWYSDNEASVHETDTQPLFTEISPITDDIPPALDRVLVADADRELTKVLSERLTNEGFEVDVVHDGKSARSIFQKYLPSIVILEAALPELDGYNLLLEIRSLTYETTVFLSSERADEFRQSKALELGADDFLVKPLSPDIIVSKVRREANRRANQQDHLSPQLGSSGVNGALEDMTVIDIVQSLELGGKTAHVVIRYIDGRHGALRVDRGELKAAYANNTSGAEAFYYLAIPGSGVFRIEYRTSLQPTNIEEPNTYLMIEAMRRLDEGLHEVPPGRVQPPQTPLAKSLPRNVSNRFEEPPDTSNVSELSPSDLTNLAEDLTLDDPQSTSHTPQPLEDWVSDQFTHEKPTTSPEGVGAPAPERADSPTDLGRIFIRRVNKPE